MPLIGSNIGQKIFFLINKSNYIVSIIFFLLSYEMYRSRNEKHIEKLSNIISLILFPLTVSIDSFSVGLALGINNQNSKVAFIIFSVVSALFTFLGLTLGNYLSKKFGNKATYLGIIILVLIAIKYLIS